MNLFMGRAFCFAFLLWPLVAGQISAGQGKYSIKSTAAQPPSELHESVRAVLDNKGIQLFDDKGKRVCEIWFRKGLPVKATPEQLKAGLTCHDLEESTLFGAVLFDELSRDYRKQKIKPGVYTLRLGFQPVDGDHMGTAPYPEFLLLLPAKLDRSLHSLETKELQEESAKAIGRSHPGVLLLYPNDKPEATPALVDKGMDTWVLNIGLPLENEGKKGDALLGVGLTLIGHSTME
jgi:hypothetical protein